MREQRSAVQHLWTRRSISGTEYATGATKSARPMLQTHGYPPSPRRTPQLLGHRQPQPLIPDRLPGRHRHTRDREDHVGQPATFARRWRPPVDRRHKFRERRAAGRNGRRVPQGEGYPITELSGLGLMETSKQRLREGGCLHDVPLRRSTSAGSACDSRANRMRCPWPVANPSPARRAGLLPNPRRQRTLTHSESLPQTGERSRASEMSSPSPIQRTNTTSVDQPHSPARSTIGAQRSL